MGFCKFSLVYIFSRRAEAKAGMGVKVEKITVIKLEVRMSLPLIEILASSSLLVRKRF